MMEIKKPTTLEQMIAITCFCKIKEFCPDKNSTECMRHKNIYDEYMQQKRPLKSQ